MFKSEEQLQSFTQYCVDNPEQRFFQALRNWVRENLDADCNSILIAPSGFITMDPEVALRVLRDTFYIE